MPTNDNELILARMRGVAPTPIRKLEAMMDPNNPNVLEANNDDHYTTHDESIEIVREHIEELEQELAELG